MAFCVNGVDGATGQFLPPLSTEQIVALARGDTLVPREPDDIASLRGWSEEHRSFLDARGVEGDANLLAEAGWGVVFAAEDKQAPAIYKALKPLLDLRRAQAASAEKAHYREILGEQGYRRGESKFDFLKRHQAGPGPAEPGKLPYYLLLVGDPEAIPYSFQYQLDIEYAVGRIHFDTLPEYEAYAAAVVAAEEAVKAGKLPARRRLALFGTCHPADPCSRLSSCQLVAPLADRLAGRFPDWDVGAVRDGEATKARLKALLGGPETPDLLFTATHGVLYGAGDERQRDRQGALVCQDWPGPGARGVAEKHSFAAADVGDEARVSGLISFQFACFSAGTPALDDFPDLHSAERRRMAAQPFVARLPQRLLAHPRGGALAVIGHVERAYPCSIEWPGVGRHIRAFECALDQLLAGCPVGMAMEAFGKRYAELAADLGERLQYERDYGLKPEDEELAQLWTASRDTRNYAVLGDPAVRLALPPDAEPPAFFRDGGMASWGGAID